MYDSVDFILKSDSVTNSDFLNTVPQYLTKVTDEGKNVFGPWISGYLDNLRVRISDRYVKIYNGSLCKYYFGNNFQTLKRKDAQIAIEHISDRLCLPINRATITRIDFAANLEMDYPVEVYYPYLGDTRYYKRLEQNNGLYYSTLNRILVFYGKIHEQKAKKKDIPLKYKNSNLLRYEMRLLNRLPSQLKQSEITAELLYDQGFYHNLVHRWLAEYQNIPKVQSRLRSIQPTGSKLTLANSLAKYALEEIGQSAILKQIQEWKSRSYITKKQVYDLRHYVRRLSISSNGAIDNSLIEELSIKIEAATDFS